MDNPTDDTIEIGEQKGKSIFWVIPIFVLAMIMIAGYFFYTNFLQNPCSIPIHYAIGDVDPRFKISKADIQSVTEDAASRWNTADGQTLLVYDPASTMRINLIYDDRQAKVDQINSVVGALNSSGNAIESLRTKLESDINQYEHDLAAYNATVESWNARGGAPPDVYAQLQTEKNSLDQRRVKINNSASLFNQQINTQNSNVDQLNNELDADKNTIITKGLYYTGEKKIDIFTFGNKEELRLVLMHELGHSLSLNHDTLSQSIMYPVLGQQDLSNPVPSAEDLAMFRQSCQTLAGGFENLWQNIFNRTIQTSP